MSDVDELRNRLVLVEGKVAQLEVDVAAERALATMADRDVAVFRPAMRGHTSVINALRETQLEQSETLAEHGRTLAEHSESLRSLRETQLEQGKSLAKQGETLAEHSKTLAEHGETLAEHSKTLAEHGETLDGHTRTLDGHTKTLAEHGQILRTLADGQTAIMQHLGIAAHDDGERTDE